MNRDDLRVAGWISFIVVVGFCITFGILGAISVAPPAPPPGPSNFEICIAAGGSWEGDGGSPKYGNCWLNGEKETYGS